MRVFRTQVAALAALQELEGDERYAAFRQGMASLAQVAVDPAAVPFEGFDGERLLASVRVALAEQLFDRLDFLPRSGAACALYAWAYALPALAPERRELGRRVLVHLQQDGLDCFVPLATALALGGARVFEGPAMRARIELALWLPTALAGGVDALAFALLSHRELAARFLVEPASGSLSARRMAAVLLERAARHAALRAQHGDDGELTVFDLPELQSALAQLVADREPLVARHAGRARGLLSTRLTRLEEELERDLMATQSLARVRRGALALAGRLALRPAETLARARELLDGPSAERDPMLAAALIAGLTRSLEVEPEASEALALLAVERGGVFAAEALVELRRELLDHRRCRAAAELAVGHLQRLLERPGLEPSQALLLRVLVRELSGERERDVEQGLTSALQAHVRAGPRAAIESALAVLAALEEQAERLARPDASLAEQFHILHALDSALLATPALHALLASAVGIDTQPALTARTRLLARVLEQLSSVEAVPHEQTEPGQLTFRMRRLRTLLHLLDSDFHGEDALARYAQLSTVAGLFERVMHDRSSAMDRIVHAALARGMDALVRADVLEPSDAMLCAGSAVRAPEGLRALSEGCLLDSLRRPLFALAELVAALEGDSDRAVVAALGTLAHALSSDTPRTEALRRALVGLTRACEAILAARSVRELLDARRAITLFEGAVIELAYLQRGAERRVGLRRTLAPLDEGCVASLARALESQAVQGEYDLEPTLEWLDRELCQALPEAIARALVRVLRTLRERPFDGALPVRSEALASAATETFPLPTWMAPSRRIGPYFIVRPLGAGRAGSTFLAELASVRGVRDRRRFALKVPRYDANAARVLSAEEFEQAFAAALPLLATLPEHENLARIVAVEPRMAPRPYLVMDWIEGPSLLRVRKRKLDPIALLAGISAALSTLHEQAVGHLDLTPERVVLRIEGSSLRPVLVDFGFAGAVVRPGCFHAAYAAPERWREQEQESSPMAIDVYALGCLAYELLTGRALFEGERASDLARAHQSHDGAPPRVVELSQDARHVRLAEWITLCLRQDPRERASAAELHALLRDF